MKKEVLSLIGKSANPYIYAGHGCTLYREKFIFFIDFMQLPVLLSWRAIDLLPDYHLLNSGRPGMIGQPDADDKLKEADLLLVLGARIDDGVTAFNIDNFAPKAVKVVVDIDKAELDRLPADYFRVHQDVGEFMDELVEVVE